MDITNYSIWLHWLIIQTWGPWYLLTESCQQRVSCSQIPEAFSATEQSLNVLLRWGDPIWPGRPCRVSCLPRTPRRWSIPLRTPPSWRSGRSLGGIQDLLEIYLFSVLAWLICSSKTLINESNLRKFWKINIVIGIEDWLIWDEAEMESIKLQHSRIFISLLITEISMPISHPRTSKLACHLSLKKFLVSTELFGWNSHLPCVSQNQLK